MWVELIKNLIIDPRSVSFARQRPLTEGPLGSRPVDARLRESWVAPSGNLSFFFFFFQARPLELLAARYLFMQNHLVALIR